jgi:energy-coupling factor transporter ATP-binding protein EcfA2
MDLLKHVTPNNISSFVGNKVTISNINKLISKVKNKQEITKNIICIMGPDGCGKTTLSTLLLQKYNFQVLEIGKDILTNDNIKTMIDNFTNNTTIEHYLCKKQKIVFIDDLDILQCVDRNIVSKITTFNKTLKAKGICILVTCNSNNDKKIFTDNEAELFKLTYPAYKDSFSFIMNRFDAANIEYDLEHLLLVVNKHKGNIRESVLNLHNTQNDLEVKGTERTFKDLNQFEVAKSILSNTNTVAELDYLMKGDIGNLPFILYENYPIELDGNYKTSNILDLYLKINECFVDAVSFEEHAYSSLDWSAVQYSNILRVKPFQCQLNNLERKATSKNVTYRFSQMRSKISHKKILAKKVKSASNHLQTSENSMILAADAFARHQSNENEIKKTLIHNNIQEVTCLMTAYQKYFA